ncbi:MAG: hypothetical protein NDI62_03210 [Burkholderiales bacterium]|nr:hypothetical protein [Burkholderiales bacterium]
MYTPLIFFFISLAGIVIMIWRELVLVRNGTIIKAQHYSHPFVLDLEKIKYLTYKNLKRFSYIALFVTLRFFIKSSNFLKTKGKITLEKLATKIRKSKLGRKSEALEKKEVSKYLRVISEYRQKIRQMKHRIKEEEGIEE